MASSSFASVLQVPPCKYDLDPSKMANLKVFDILNRVESGSIKWIVGQISLLCKLPLSSSRDVGGVNVDLSQVKSLLWMSINDIRVVGILGYGRSRKDNDFCFLADVKKCKKRMRSSRGILVGLVMAAELLQQLETNI